MIATLIRWAPKPVAGAPTHLPPPLDPLRILELNDEGLPVTGHDPGRLPNRYSLRSALNAIDMGVILFRIYLGALILAYVMGHFRLRY